MKKIYLILILLTLILGAENSRLELNKIIHKEFQAESLKRGVIALSAHNKMLSQKISKDVVMIANGVDVENHRQDLIRSTQIFNDFLLAMYRGDAKRHIEKTTDETVLQELGQIKDEWKKFCLHVLKFYKQSEMIDQDSYLYIINNNEKLLRLSHKLTQTLKSKSRLNINFNKVIEHTLKIADRQKMLTQKMFKEKFLVYIKEDSKRNSVRLRGSLILFKNGLLGLINGDKKRGLAKVTDLKIQEKLQKMWSLYKEVEEFYLHEGTKEGEIERLSTIEKELLKYSTEIVTMIESTLEY